MQTRFFIYMKFLLWFYHYFNYIIALTLYRSSSWIRRYLLNKTHHCYNAGRV